MPLGALILAVGRLGADAETAAAIARLLQVEGRVAASNVRALPDRTQASSPLEPQPRYPRRVISLQDSGTPPARPLRSPTHAPTSRGNLRVSLRSGPTQRPVIARPSFREGRPFSATPLPFEPLLHPLGTRAIVGAVVATPRAGAIDVDGVAGRIARRQALEPLPRHRFAGVPGTVVVIVDCGPGMAPFAPDAEALVVRIASVAGRDRTQIARVYQSPQIRTYGGSSTPLALPPRGSAVVALSDLGIAPAEQRVPHLHEDWLVFAAELHARSCRLVAFVPYPPTRWPRSLGAKMILLPWDRTTGLAVVVRALRRSEGFRWKR